MLSHEQDRADQLEVLQNDLRVRQERAEKRQPDKPSTYADHYIQEETGRFAQHGAATIVDGKSSQVYPAASFAHQTDLPPEIPLGYSINDPVGRSEMFAQDDLGPAPAPMPTVVERAGPPILGVSHRQDTGPTSAAMQRGVGPSLSRAYRRF